MNVMFVMKDLQVQTTWLGIKNTHRGETCMLTWHP